MDWLSFAWGVSAGGVAVLVGVALVAIAIGKR